MTVIDVAAAGKGLEESPSKGRPSHEGIAQRMMRTPLRRAVVLFMAVVITVTAVVVPVVVATQPRSAAAAAGAAGQCPVSYAGNSKAFLFGGLQEATCSQNDGQQCAVRSPKWDDNCRYDPSQVRFPVCGSEQAQLGLTMAQQARGGEALQLAPCGLYPYLRGRTLWIMGDSHSKQLMRALQCFMIDFWDGTECKVSGAPGAAEEIDNLPTRPGESKCIHLAGNGRVCFIHVVLGTSLVNSTLPDGGLLNRLRNKGYASPDDIFLIQFGPWHNKLGLPGIEDMKSALVALGEDFQANKGKWPHVIWRETPMTHDRDDKNKVCLPAPPGWTFDAANAQITVTDAAAPERTALLGRGGFLNVNGHDILPNYGLPVMGGFAYSVPLHQAHIGTRGSVELDCLHYCSFGLPEILVYEMARDFKNGIAGVKPLPAVSPSLRRECTPMP